MISYVTVRYDERERGRVAFVTIDNAKKLNSLTSQVMGQLVDLFHGLAADLRLRAIVLHWFDWSRRHAEGCVLLSAASEYDGRDGALHDGVVSQQSQWRAALAKAAGTAIR